MHHYNNCLRILELITVIMDKRLKSIIYDYYANLDYDEDMIDGARTKQFTSLTKELTFTDVNDFSERFLKASSIMKDNLSLFKSYEVHTDVITTIIEYLNYFGMKFMLDSKYDEKYEKDDIVLLVLFTILETCGDREMQCFFRNAIIENSALGKSNQYERLRRAYRSHTVEIILLADSDLYAFRACLDINFHLSKNKIWVQEPIKEKFLWIMEDYWSKDYWNDYGLFIDYESDICIFRTREELFTARTADKINIVSIWTEDIVFAKNLAMSLNGDVLFINSYLNFYGGILLMPFTKIFEKTYWWEHCEPYFDDSIRKLSMQKSSVYNLFYDGMWQRPVKGTYWIHNDSQWANATSDDINRCIKSAERGLEIWSNKSITHKMQILSKFASTLECSGKSVLADIISKWINFSCIYEKTLSSTTQSEKLEVTEIRNPRGVIILKEIDEAVLFRRLMQALTVGNTVIMICGANSCSLVPYCNMFSTSEIPPGVINLLLSEKVKELGLSLCGMDYASYAKRFFSEDIEETYMNLTKPKQIIIPLK